MLDQSPVFMEVAQSIIGTIVLVVTLYVKLYLPKLVDAFSKRTGIAFTEQQRTTMLNAVDTGVGILQTDLDKGAMALGEVHVANPKILSEALNVINAVPQAAAFFGVTKESVARQIVARLNTTPQPTSLVTTPVTLGTAP
jgi:hypothetical protein